MDPSTINKIENLSLRARLVVEGFIIGLHRSPYHGFSVEFSEHRPYGFGDEIKYIDWKLWGRTDRFYIKQFEEETNLKCYILFDKSASMNYGSGDNTKFSYLFKQDIQITNRMKNYNIGNLPNFETAKEFSIEKYYHPKAFGGHQFWFTI